MVTLMVLPSLGLVGESATDLMLGGAFEMVTMLLARIVPVASPSQGVMRHWMVWPLLKWAPVSVAPVWPAMMALLRSHW